MAEHLLNIREAAEYLGIGERAVKELVDAGELPAYKIGGAFLRFKKNQLVSARAALYGKANSEVPAVDVKAVSDGDMMDAVKDFFYFNDFYILSVVTIIIAIVLIVAT